MMNKLILYEIRLQFIMRFVCQAVYILSTIKIIRFADIQEEVRRGRDLTPDIKNYSSELSLRTITNRHISSIFQLVITMLRFQETVYVITVSQRTGKYASNGV